jgi:hypothetical protein
LNNGILAVDRMERQFIPLGQLLVSIFAGAAGAFHRQLPLGSGPIKWVPMI